MKKRVDLSKQPVGHRSSQQRSASEHRNKRKEYKPQFYRPHSSQGYRQTGSTFGQPALFESCLAQSSSPKAAFKTSENSDVPNFYERVNCPFCLEVQKDKIALIKHWDDKCQRECRQTRGRGMPYSVFQLLPNNSIKCNVCPYEVFPSFESYLLHADWENHVINCSNALREGRKLTEFLYCASCQVQIPDNYTELKIHLQHKTHEVQRKCKFSSDYCDKKGIRCLYGLFSNEKAFKCIACPKNSFSFSTTEVIKHLRSDTHLLNSRYSSSYTIYCCFCDEEFNSYEIPFHFTSTQHVEKERGILEDKLCFYCGFACANQRDLLLHMTGTCTEIIKIRQELKEGADQKGISKTEQNAGEDEAAGKCKSDEPEIKTDRCILVKENVDIFILIRQLRNIGEISSVSTYKDDVLIEFKDKNSIEVVRLLRNVLKINGKKVDIKILEDGRDTSAKTKTSTKKPRT